MKYKIISILILVFLISCAKKDVHLEEDLSIQFEKAMKFFNKEKYSRAKDEYDYIIMTDPGSKLANESLYFLAESMFQLEEYVEASTVYDRYVRFSPDFTKIESARYRICECAINLSNSYQRDQSQTHNALGQLQMFIEDFPESDSINDAEEAIGSLRLKLARKDYETGRIYLKLEEYESALVYFQSVMNQYYDTGVSDDARIGIIFTHILNDNHKGAHSYLHSQTGKFLSEDKYNEAETLLQDTEMGLKLAQYYQLYR